MPHDGVECPVDGDQKVVVQYRSGATNARIGEAISWQHVVAYGIYNPPEWLEDVE